MKIAIIPPPQILHAIRGTGVYTDLLVEYLKKRVELSVVVCSYNQVPSDTTLIHFTYFDPFFLTLPLIKRQPTIVTVHDLIPLRFPEYFPRGIQGEIKWQIQKYSLQSATHIITDSDASRADVTHFTGCPREKISRVYLSPDPIFEVKLSGSFMESVQRKYQLPKSFVLYVGDINWNKNILRIIRTLKKLDIPLVIVNKSFTQALQPHVETDEALKAQTESANNRNIIKIGYVQKNELAALYRLATVFFFPSHYEGFGLPVAEAFLSGCPVVSSDKGSLKEIIGDAACIVDPDDITDMSAKLKKVYTDTSVQAQYRKKGLAQVKKFNWDKTAEETLSIYKRVHNTI